MGLVPHILAEAGGIGGRSAETIDWVIQADSQITFREFLRSDIADEGEAMAELEVRLSDDVAFEAGGSRDTEVSAIAQSEDQLLTASDRLRGGHRRRSATARGAPVVVQVNSTRLAGGTVRI